MKTAQLLRLPALLAALLALAARPAFAADVGQLVELASPAAASRVSDPAYNSANVRLEAAQNALALAALNLSALEPADAATYGGHVEAARASLHATLADLATALTALANAPIRTAENLPPAAPLAPGALALPRLPQVAFNAPRTPLVEAVDALNEALAALVRDHVSADGRAAIPGVSAALNAKIFAGLGRAGAELSAGVEFRNHLPGPAALAETAPPESLVPTAIAGIALSLGLSFGGLYFFARKKI